MKKKKVKTILFFLNIPLSRTPTIVQFGHYCLSWLVSSIFTECPIVTLYQLKTVRQGDEMVDRLAGASHRPVGSCSEFDPQWVPHYDLVLNNAKKTSVVARWLAN